MGIRGHQADTGQAAGDEVGEELVPRCPGFSGGYADAEDFAVAVAVDSGGQQRHRVDDPAAFADLHGQRVGGDERERARVGEGAVAEVLDDRVQISGHPRHLGLRESVDPQRLHQLVHPPGADAGEVTVRDDGDQRGLRTLATLEEPLGEVGARAELGDRDIDRADPSVQVTVPVAVALRRPAPADGRPHSAPTTASASAESRALMIDCSNERIRSGLASARASPSRPAGSTMWGAVIVMFRSRDLWKVNSKDHAVAAPTSTTGTNSATALHHYRGLN